MSLSFIVTIHCLTRALGFNTVDCCIMHVQPVSQASSRCYKTLTAADGSGLGLSRNWGLAKRSSLKQRQKGAPWRSNWNMPATKWTWRSGADKRLKRTVRSWYDGSIWDIDSVCRYPCWLGEFPYLCSGCISINTGSSNSVDPGPPDQWGIHKQPPAECGTAVSFSIPEHKLSGSDQPEHKSKVIFSCMQWCMYDLDIYTCHIDTLLM